MIDLASDMQVLVAVTVQEVLVIVQKIEFTVLETQCRTVLALARAEYTNDAANAFCLCIVLIQSESLKRVTDS